MIEESKEEGAVSQVSSLSKKAQGRPLLLGQELDKSVQDYINTMRKVGGVVNTAIVMAAANGIIVAKSPALLTQHGGHTDITKAWAKSLLKRMGYVKRKCSNAGKISVAHFEEVQEVFLAYIKAEVLMNEIYTPTANLQLGSNRHSACANRTVDDASCQREVIPIANSDDKRQITALLAATLTGEYLPLQVIYKGKTLRCHTNVSFPQGWDVWHSDNHWLNEETMKRYIEKIIVPFVSQKREP